MLKLGTILKTSTGYWGDEFKNKYFMVIGYEPETHLSSSSFEEFREVNKYICFWLDVKLIISYYPGELIDSKLFTIVSEGIK
tara:strand:+ start:173 stop:418 length:246 start_codon:yes stop_codon:yes gene_type:complete